MLDLDGISLMIDQIGEGRDFFPGLTVADRPLGRGINLEIELPDIAPILSRIETSSLPLYLPLEEKWYAREDDEIGVRQFIIADPDGYLLRFSEEIGTRPKS